jgi:ATP-dependent DNA helicase DinG
MAQAAAAAFEGREHLLVQAGTGTGKSVAYLVPAVLDLLNGRSTVVSTATLALQRQLIAKDIPAVLDRLSPALAPVLGRSPVAALLKGRGNYVCRLRLVESGSSAESDPDGLFELPGRLEREAAKIRRWAGQSTTGDRDDLPDPVDPRVWRALSVNGRECVGRARCPYGSECFSEAARDAAAEADLVVTNHALLAIHAVGEAPVLPEFDNLVVDEAHDLAARTTSAATGTLSGNLVRDAVRGASTLVDAALLERCADAAQALDRALAAAELEVAGRPDRRLKQAPQELVRALALVRDAAYATISALSARQSDPDSIARAQRVVAALTDVHDIAGTLIVDDPARVRWVAEDPAGLAVAPLSVGDLLGRGLFDRATVVATSATLTVGESFAPTAVDLGLFGRGGRAAGAPSPSGAAAGGAEAAGPEPGEPGWSHLDVGSPFDYRRQGILYVPQDLPPPGREAVAQAVLDRISTLVRAAGGRTLVLAATWRGAEAITEHLLAEHIPGVVVLAQTRGMPVAPLVAAFAAQEESVLVGTLSLWQGVDVPGRACACVIIDKLPFPRPDDPVLAARAEAAAARGASGFATVSLPHAALLLAQGAGRLIRSADDRGVVAVLDPRLRTKSYGGTLLASLPPMWRTDDLPLVVGALERLRAGTAQHD